MGRKQTLKTVKHHRVASNNPVGRPPSVDHLKVKAPRLTKDAIAKMLWQDDYMPLFENFMDRHVELKNMLESYLHANRSTYAQRLEGEALAQYMKRTNFKLVEAMSLINTLGHQLKGQDIPKVLHSILAVGERTSVNDWTRSTKGGKLCSMQTGKDWLKLMKGFN